MLEWTILSQLAPLQPFGSSFYWPYFQLRSNLGFLFANSANWALDSKSLCWPISSNVASHSSSSADLPLGPPWSVITSGPMTLPPSTPLDPLLSFLPPLYAAQSKLPPWFFLSHPVQQSHPGPLALPGSPPPTSTPVHPPLPLGACILMILLGFTCLFRPFSHRILP